MYFPPNGRDDMRKVLHLTSPYTRSHLVPIIYPTYHYTITRCSSPSSALSYATASASQPRLPSLSVLLSVEGKTLADTETIQALLIKNGLLGIPTYSHKLVHSYLKCCGLAEARRVFDEMPSRHVVTWNSMVSACVRHGRAKEAIRLYGRMLGEGVFPDEYTFSPIFGALSDMGLVLEGRKAHGTAVVLGLGFCNEFVGSALVDMYAKFGNMEDARLVADRVVEQDVVLITSLIVGYSRNGRDADAVCALRDMMRKGIGANEYTLASTLICCGNIDNLDTGKSIHAVIVKSGFVSFVAPQTALLTMYLKFGLVDDSVQVFSCLDDPNVVTWTSLITGMAQNGREETAISYFREMLRGSVNPNSHTLSSVIQSCSSMAMLEIGNQIHGLSMKLGWLRNLFIGAALIDLYGKCGIAEMARSVFDEFKEMDVVSVNSMIYSYAVNGFGAAALHLYGRMKQLSIEPNGLTYLSVMLACSNACLIEEGRGVFAELRERPDIEVTEVHYACFVDLLGKSGRLEEAKALVSEVGPTDVVLWRVLLNSCRIHDEVEMAEGIVERVRELVPGDGWSHVVMSNLYASSRKWDRVIEMRGILRETGLKKDRAMSWVHVDREIHTFMAGDLSHPDSPEVLETLEELIQKARSLGYVPNIKYVYHDVGHDKQEALLYYHSEKLAIAFALSRTRDSSSSIIRILKNLRMCGDCHAWTKLVSLVTRRMIMVRDVNRYHHFDRGSCSCGDFW